MASGQCHSLCGHIMAGFDLDDKCARSCDKRLGSDACIVGGAIYICIMCDGFTDIQTEILATPHYQIHKNKWAGSWCPPKM